MTTPIDLEDVRKNPQDYLVDGNAIKTVETVIWWVDSKDSITRCASSLRNLNSRLTSKPKIRKIKVRPWFDRTRAVRFFAASESEMTESQVEGSLSFVCWAGPEQEIEVTE